jgi:hypothetical protein
VKPFPVRWSFHPGPVALAAGFLLLAAFARADDVVPPGRSVSLTPVSGADAAVVSVLGDQVDRLRAQAQAQAALLDAQVRAVRLSAETQSDQEARLKQLADGTARLDQGLSAAQGSLTQAQARLQAVEEAQAKTQVNASAESAQADGMARDLAALKQSMAVAQDSLQAGAKDLAATRVQMEDRSEKLDSLSELLETLKKSQESNDEELVEVKQALKRLEPAPDVDGGNLQWWDEILTWKYMPAVAVGLGCVATGIALAHK